LLLLTKYTAVSASLANESLVQSFAAAFFTRNLSFAAEKKKENS
jgi:hypothetical protein